jgi:hypothetical protein
MTKFEFTTKQKAYLPADVPEDLREILCQREAEFLEPEFLSESIQDYLGESLRERGIEEFKLEGWQLHCQGAGVSLSFEVTDLEKFLAGTGLDAETQRLVLGADKVEGISARAVTAAGHYPGTKAEEDSRNPHHDYVPHLYKETSGYPVEIGFDPDHRGYTHATAMGTALDDFVDTWEDFVRDTESEAFRLLEAEYDHLTSWEQVEERLEIMDEMVTEEGTVVSAAECEAITEED